MRFFMEIKLHGWKVSFIWTVDFKWLQDVEFLSIKPFMKEANII